MDLTTRDVDTVFAELICADPQWTRGILQVSLDSFL